MNCKKHIDTSGILYFAETFFSLPVSEQDAWIKKSVGVSAVTFRRWCKAAGIKRSSTAIKE